MEKMKETVIQSDCLSAIYILGAGMSVGLIVEYDTKDGWRISKLYRHLLWRPKCCLFLPCLWRPSDWQNKTMGWNVSSCYVLWQFRYRHLLNRFCLGVLRNEFVGGDLFSACLKRGVHRLVIVLLTALPPYKTVQLNKTCIPEKEGSRARRHSVSENARIGWIWIFPSFDGANSWILDVLLFSNDCIF